MNNKPDFLLIGAMKCATSTLHVQLAAQKSIFMSELKEPNFFSDDSQYSKGLDWYYSNFSSAQSNNIKGESSTHYTKLPTYPNTINRIVDHLGHDTKFIYLMRHPIDRLISQYIHEWTELKIKEDINTAIHNHSELINYSRYHYQIEPYITTFGKSSILLVFQEALIANPQSELERICRFLGIEHEVAWNFENDKQNSSNQRMKKSAIRDFIIDLPILKEVRKNFIPQSLRDRIKELWMMKNRPNLSKENINHLTKVFNEDLDKLSALITTDIDCDNFKSKVTNERIEWR